MFSNPMEYWELQEERSDQHFYTGYCVFASAIQSHVAGTLMKSIPEWSIIAQYYSCIHSLRLPLLLFFGDYPSSHSRLVNFYRGWQIVRGERREKNVVEGNWIGPTFNIEIQRSEIQRQEFIDTMRGLRDESWFEHLGDIIGKLSEIRTRINYEGLIIAHRADPPYVTHPRVSSVAANLVDLSFKLAQITLEFASNSISHFIEITEDANKRNRWCSYLNWNSEEQPNHIEGIEYLEHLTLPSINFNLDETYHPIYNRDFLQGLLNQLRRKHTFSDDRIAKRMFHNIEPHKFIKKGEVFDDFEKNVKELKEFFQDL